jgi:hypothetical protein
MANPLRTGDLLHQFVSWERMARDVIDFKRIYVDMTGKPGEPLSGDPLAGLMLSQIVYYHLPDRRGNPRLHIERGGNLWLVKRRTDWWEECRIKPKQADRILGVLGKGRKIGSGENRRFEPGRDLLVVELHRFRKAPTQFIRLNFPVFLDSWEEQVAKLERSSIFPYGGKRADSISPDGENQINSPDGEEQKSPDGEVLIISPDGENHIQKKKEPKVKEEELILYSSFIEDLEGSLPPGSFTDLFSGSFPILPSFSDSGELAIVVNTESKKERIEGFLVDQLDRLVLSHFGDECSWRIMVGPELETPRSGDRTHPPREQIPQGEPQGWVEMEF